MKPSSDRLTSVSRPTCAGGTFPTGCLRRRQSVSRRFEGSGHILGPSVSRSQGHVLTPSLRRGGPSVSQCVPVCPHECVPVSPLLKEGTRPGHVRHANGRGRCAEYVRDGCGTDGTGRRTSDQGRVL